MRLRRITSLVAVACATAVLAAPMVSAQKRAAATAAPALTLETVSRDADQFIGMAPTQIRWSGDGQMIYFEWNPGRNDTSSLYALPASGGQPRKQTPEEVRLIPSAKTRGDHAPEVVNTSYDGSLVAYERQGDIFLQNVRSGKVVRITSTEAVERNPRVTQNLASVTFESANNLFVHDIASGALTQVTNFRTGRTTGRPPNEQEKYLEAQQLELFDFVKRADRQTKEQTDRNRLEKGVRLTPTSLTDAQSVQDMEVSPDRQFVTFTLVDDTKLLATRMVEYPDYVNSTGFVEMRRFASSTAVKPTEAFRDNRLGVVTVADAKVRYVDSQEFGKKVSWNPLLWSHDGRHAVAWAGSQDHKDLWLCAIDLKTATPTVLFHEHDDAWVRGFRAGRWQRGDGQTTGFLRDGRTVYFLSEQDGWFHLYTVGTEGEALRQLTRGAFEVAKPTLSKDGARWYFLSSEGNLFQQQLYTMPVAGGLRTKLTARDGWYEDYAVSPDEATIILRYETATSPPDLFMMDNNAGAEQRQATFSRTEEFKQYAFQAPEFVTIPDKDGWRVHAELYRPARPHLLHPAIIHVHGSGWAHGTGNRYEINLPENRLQFQFYADQGYTVLNVDYKASRGYGRESRTAIYMKLGTPEVESLDAAVEYLVTTCGVDRKRIGLYGHSQGGYVTLMGLLTRPGVFAAGAAQAPPTDSSHGPVFYWHTRVLNIPWQEPDAYRRSSPIYYADKLQDRLLILQGVNDTNVPLQEALRLTQRFIELKKTGWELALYPVETHMPRQDTSRLDIERRRLALFESVLKAPRGIASGAGQAK